MTRILSWGQMSPSINSLQLVRTTTKKSTIAKILKSPQKVFLIARHNDFHILVMLLVLNLAMEYVYADR